MAPNNQYIAELLQTMGLITSEQAKEALEHAHAHNGNVVDVLAKGQIVDRNEVIKKLAEASDMDTVSLADTEIPPEVLKTLPADLALRYRVVPLYATEDLLKVAIGDPFDVETLDSLHYVLNIPVEGVVAPIDEIDQAIRRYYPESADAMATMLEQMSERSVAPSHGSSIEMIGDSDVTEADTPIIKLVSLIIYEAFRNHASDIHLEPLEKKFQIRYRIDGVLHEVESPPRRLQSAIVSRVKIMANMRIAEKRLPQDGRIQIRIKGRDLDLRVSTVPGNHGEAIVMRILDKESLQYGLSQLGFYADDQQQFERLIELPDGILLVTGPTGSGKTTTLYSCLNHINRPDRKIITVEDPVEYQLKGINQVQVHNEIGLSFSLALRSILRQAPNIIMIGEIRDLETAEIAVNASLTGHLVFSTLHTNDAPSAITRLLDLGVKPFLVASSIRAIMAQRLVRKICSHCKQEVRISDNERYSLGRLAEQVEQATLHKGVGCKECVYTGYRGRTGIYEVFLVDDLVQHMIYQRASSTSLREKAREQGMRTLREDGIRKCMSGVTTLQEVFRVTMGDQIT